MELLPLIITVDISYSNSSALVSNLTIDGVMDHLVTNVACNDLLKEVVENFGEFLVVLLYT